MVSRLFTFGCSFTQYYWPTWADILGREFNYYENWGKFGTGNQYIFHSLIECYLSNSLSKNDTVLIMWSNTTREDRYINGRWKNAGELIHQSFYDKIFIEKYCDARGSLLRDLSVITATKELLDKWGVNYKFLSMIPIDSIDIYAKGQHPDIDLLQFFKSTVDIIAPSFYEVIYNFDYYSRSSEFGPGINKKEHAIFIKERYTTNAGGDWPTYDNFLIDNFAGITTNVIEEIQNLQLFNLRDMPPRKDLHPPPKLQLEYIQKILPHITLSQNTLDWINAYAYGDKFNPHLPIKRL